MSTPAARSALLSSSRHCRPGLLAGLALVLLAGCSGINDQPAVPAKNGKRPWSELDPVSLHKRVTALVPRSVRDRKDWAGDLIGAYDHLKIKASPENFCASIAIIAQESSFHADPAVPGLPRIVQSELERRVEALNLPKSMLLAALQLKSPTGKTYQQRIATLRTEKQLSDLYEDIIANLPFGQRLFADYNPVRTGGPMQVSIRFAEQLVREKGYPYPLEASVRSEMFSRRGGVYFGSAILLDYPAPYSDMRYRFADFNAGRYASRNAAFQKTLEKLSGQPLDADGDLLRYANGDAGGGRSAVETVLRDLSFELGLSSREIRRDLLAEKSAEFSESALYESVYRLAESRGIRAPREAMPEITLKSPKITRKLTTEWFAKKVERRYKACLALAVN